MGEVDWIVIVQGLVTLAALGFGGGYAWIRSAASPLIVRGLAVLGALLAAMLIVEGAIRLLRAVLG